MLLALAAMPAAAAAALPDLCHAKPSLNIAVGSGSGNASVDSSGCAALHFKSTGGMAADFTTGGSFAIKPLQHYLVTMELKTADLLPTPLIPHCIERQQQQQQQQVGAAAGAEAGDKPSSCQGAYLTGGIYVTYTDAAGRSDGWYPAYGTHATPTADWHNVSLEFAPPTTAAQVELHFTFGAHEWALPPPHPPSRPHPHLRRPRYAYKPDRTRGGTATGECWMRKLAVKEISGKRSAVLPVTFSIPSSEVNLSAAAALAGNCLHNSQISGNFTVGSDYVISGNLSPDLAFGLLGTRRLAHASYMRTWEATW